MYPPLPRNFIPTKDAAAAAYVNEPALVEALAESGVPIMELRLAGRVHRYVAKPKFDRWLLKNITKMAPEGVRK